MKSRRIKCIVCGKHFTPRTYENVCSLSCFKKLSTMEIRYCKRCGKAFAVSTKRTKKYCSENCRKRSFEKKERLNKLPSGGMRRIKNRLKCTLEYEAWRKSILDRDHYTCRVCGATEWLHVHHIVPIHEDMSKMFQKKNGITLCATCHTIVHGYFISNKADLDKTTDKKYCNKMKKKYLEEIGRKP